MSLDRKALYGHKIRRLRADMAVTQAEMAAQLGISPSYLNLIERNQRPITVPLLLKLGQVFGVDLQGFAETAESDLMARLRGALADLVFEGHEVPDRELRLLATEAPEAARALIRLYGAWQVAQEQLQAMAESVAVKDGTPAQPQRIFPVEEVRDFFLEADNHFPDLEQAAEALVERLGLRPGMVWAQMLSHLAEQGIQIRILPREVLGPTLRRYDRHSRRILLSEMLLPTARVFQLLVQMALLLMAPVLDGILDRHHFQSEDSRRLARAGLANYVAAAVLMPYERFLQAARDLRYDLEVLARRFDCSLEQVCHRITTLQRPGAKGVPFFLIRADKAGNISKRFSAKGVPFTRLGGACPRWVLYDAFRSPGMLQTQLGELPDGSGWLTMAVTAASPSTGAGQPPQLFAIAVGCELRHAAQITYADGLDLKSRAAAVPIGINCRLCERPDCAQRAHPPLNTRLVLEDHHRGLSPYGFSRSGRDAGGG